MSRSSTYPDTAGFTVLEVLVALAILATAFAVLLGLQQSATRAALGVERVHDRLKLDRGVLEYFRPLNPTLQPEGSITLAGALVSWHSEKISEPRTALSTTGDEGRFILQIYRVTVTIAAPERPPRQWSVELLGWRPRSPASPGLN